MALLCCRTCIILILKCFFAAISHFTYFFSLSFFLFFFRYMFGMLLFTMQNVGRRYFHQNFEAFFSVFAKKNKKKGKKFFRHFFLPILFYFILYIFFFYLSSLLFFFFLLFLFHASKLREYELFYSHFKGWFLSFFFFFFSFLRVIRRNPREVFSLPL